MIIGTFRLYSTENADDHGVPILDDLDNVLLGHGDLPTIPQQPSEDRI